MAAALRDQGGKTDSSKNQLELIRCDHRATRTPGAELANPQRSAALKAKTPAAGQMVDPDAKLIIGHQKAMHETYSSFAPIQANSMGMDDNARPDEITRA